MTTESTIYVDDRGWLYKVMPGLGLNAYKGRYQKPGKSGWKCMTNLPWQSDFETAQADLDALATDKGWRVAKGGDVG